MMNPIPLTGNVPTGVLPVDGALELMLLVTLVSTSVIFLMLLWSVFRLESHTLELRRAVADNGRPKPAGGTRIDLIRPWPAGRPTIDHTKAPLRRTTAA